MQAAGGKSKINAQTDTGVFRAAHIPGGALGGSGAGAPHPAPKTLARATAFDPVTKSTRSYSATGFDNAPAGTSLGSSGSAAGGNKDKVGLYSMKVYGADSAMNNGRVGRAWGSSGSDSSGGEMMNTLLIVVAAVAVVGVAAVGALLFIQRQRRVAGQNLQSPDANYGGQYGGEPDVEYA